MLCLPYQVIDLGILTSNTGPSSSELLQHLNILP